MGCHGFNCFGSGIGAVNIMAMGRSQMSKQVSKGGKKKDPKVGTGKKPKGSGRRLYTDENPKDTVSIKFATVADARKTIAKVMKIKLSSLKL